MTRDNVYIFDKITFEETLLGEIQTDFNMGLTIDGTKDSTTIIVNSFSDIEVEPYTILWHAKTDTWWIVSHDKVERSANASGILNSQPYESYVYTHNLELEGAVELFNARDLTDCGFNSNKYTIGSFLVRLFSLSNFEFPITLNSFDTQIALNKKVSYIKSFENYTLNSALREFLDGYNACAKLTFTTYVFKHKKYLSNAIIHILSKTGNNNLTQHNISDFKDVKEIKTIDKNSFGTCAVSNANNVISSQAKTYPVAGFVTLSSNEYNINFENSLLRLPSNIYKLNWVKMVASKIPLTIVVGSNVMHIYVFYDNMNKSIYNMNYLINVGLQQLLETEVISQRAFDSFVENKQKIIDSALEYCEIMFYSGVEYNPDNTITVPSTIPYVPEFESKNLGGDPQKIAIFTKEERDCIQPQGGNILALYYERGSNLIQGFSFLDTNNKVLLYKSTNGGYNNHDVSGPKVIYRDEYSEIIVYVGDDYDTEPCIYFDVLGDVDAKPLFIVNYIPMADIKLKVDNQRDKRDIQLYNQNGKMTDSFALSKLLNSYAKEISSDNIVRYGQYYKFSDIPQVGSFVNTPNGKYIINNVSMTFYTNEKSDNDFGYFIDCEFNMCKWVSTKSLMVNPNSNIRDYGIPQNYNVKRKQVYRDYYELSYVKYSDSNETTPYVHFEKLLTFDREYKEIAQFSSFIKAVYDHPVGGDGTSDLEASDTWYYQLDCSSIIISKQVVVVCDFQDNNIIGYSSTNRNFVFDVAHLFDQHSEINTPISYVDENGNVKDFYILFADKEQREQVDNTYYDDVGYTNNQYDALMTQVFIPKELYDIAYNNDLYEFELDLVDYDKDAIEVPVFIYSMQLGDSQDILIGDEILNQHENCIYFYTFVKGENLSQDNIIDDREITVRLNPERYLISNCAKIENVTENVQNPYISIGLVSSLVYIKETGEWNEGTVENFESGKDYAIFKHSFNLKTFEQTSELMFIAKIVPSSSIENNNLIIYTNYYKLN